MNNNFLYYSSIFAGIYSVVAGLSYYTYSGEQYITANKAKKLLKDHKIKAVIDVRTKVEYDIGHYKNAIHFPVAKMTPKSIPIIMSKNKIHKDDTILVYCNTGQRARNAADKLNKAGFKKVFYIPGTFKSLE